MSEIERGVVPLVESYNSIVDVADLARIHLDPLIMGGKPCIRGTRVTVGTVVGLLATGMSEQSILAQYPYLASEDIRAALSYAAWRSEESETPLASA